MFFADEISTPIAIVGGGAGILAFVLAILKIYSTDAVWKSLIEEIRKELTAERNGREEQRIAHAQERSEWRVEKAELQANCRAELIVFENQVKSLEGEVISLRRELHVDKWLGTSPGQRPTAPTLYDQRKDEDGSTDASDPSGPSS